MDSKNEEEVCVSSIDAESIINILKNNREGLISALKSGEATAKNKVIFFNNIDAQIELYGKSSDGTWWPLRTWIIPTVVPDLELWGQLALKVRCHGHKDQLNDEPSGNFFSTPHADTPEHETGLVTEGSPGRKIEVDSVTLTDLFKTAHTIYRDEIDIQNSVVD